MQILLLLAAAFPQGEVLVDAAVESASVQAGATIELRVGMDIPAGWHVYHPDQESDESRFRSRWRGLRRPESLPATRNLEFIGKPLVAKFTKPCGFSGRQN